MWHPHNSKSDVPFSSTLLVFRAPEVARDHDLINAYKGVAVFWHVTDCIETAMLWWCKGFPPCNAWDLYIKVQGLCQRPNTAVHRSKRLE